MMTLTLTSITKWLPTPTMKILFIITFTFLNIEFGWLPKPDLLIVMGCAMIVDFICGVARATFNREKKTSLGFRRTIKKFIQYGGAILIGMGISYLGNNIKEYNKAWDNVAVYMSWFNTGLITFIILIEILSILENLYAINHKSAFAKYALRPALRILTIELSKNPLTKVTVETEDASIKEEDVKAMIVDNKKKL